MSFAPPGFVFGLAIYGLIWFITLFAILPLGVQTQAESGSVVKGSAESAPVAHRMGFKLALTTAVAGLVYGALYLVLVLGKG